MRPSLLFSLVLALASCESPPGRPGLEARIEGRLVSRLPGVPRGDAYLLLYDVAQPRSLEQRPVYVTAIPDGRLSAGDARFVFGTVAPGRYRLEGFVDTDRNADLTVEELSQPTAGDLVVEPIEIELGAGEQRSQEVALARRVLRDPPAFRLGADTPVLVELPDQPAVRSIVVESDGLGLLAPAGFHVRYVDADGDGVPDDANGDLAPDLEPQLFLRFRPLPGQTVPLSSDGEPAEVIVPLAFNPAPFLVALEGDVTREVVVESLTAFMLPQAQAVWLNGNVRTVETLGAIPVGAYELVVLDSVSGFWRIPNRLAERGGVFATQGTKFRVVHGGGFDAGVLTPPTLP